MEKKTGFFSGQCLQWCLDVSYQSISGNYFPKWLRIGLLAWLSIETANLELKVEGKIWPSQNEVLETREGFFSMRKHNDKTKDGHAGTKLHCHVMKLEKELGFLFVETSNIWEMAIHWHLKNFSISPFALSPPGLMGLFPLASGDQALFTPAFN